MHILTQSAWDTIIELEKERESESEPNCLVSSVALHNAHSGSIIQADWQSLPLNPMMHLSQRGAVSRAYSFRDESD